MVKPPSNSFLPELGWAGLKGGPKKHNRSRVLYAFKCTKVAKVETNVRTNQHTYIDTAHTYKHKTHTHIHTSSYTHFILLFLCFLLFCFTLLYFIFCFAFVLSHFNFFFSFSFCCFSHLWQTKGAPAQDQRIAVNSEPHWEAARPPASPLAHSASPLLQVPLFADCFIVQWLVHLFSYRCCCCGSCHNVSPSFSLSLLYLFLSLYARPLTHSGRVRI